MTGASAPYPVSGSQMLPGISDRGLGRQMVEAGKPAAAADAAERR